MRLSHVPGRSFYSVEQPASIRPSYCHLAAVNLYSLHERAQEGLAFGKLCLFEVGAQLSRVALHCGGVYPVASPWRPFRPPHGLRSSSAGSGSPFPGCLRTPLPKTGRLSRPLLSHGAGSLPVSASSPSRRQPWRFVSSTVEPCPPSSVRTG